MNHQFLQNSPLLLIIDGHSILFRAWFGIPQDLTAPNGQNVKGVYGFSNTLLKVVRLYKPTHIVATFDTGKPTFRHNIYSEYKANRPDLEPDILTQIPITKELLKTLKIPIFQVDGFEADDLVGTVAHLAEQEGAKSLILTGDSDQLQLVSSNVNVIMYSGHGESMLYDSEKVKEKYDGLGPEFVAQIKALQGDKSDNIPGVPGIGAKTAIRLLQHFGSIEHILKNLDELVYTPNIRGAKRAKDTIEKHKDSIPLWLKLTQIDKHVQTDFKLSDATFGTYNNADVQKHLSELGFKSIEKQIHNLQGKLLIPEELTKQKVAVNSYLRTNTVTDESALLLLVDTLLRSSCFAFDTETDGLHPHLAPIIGISFCTEEGVGWYVPFGHDQGTQLKVTTVTQALKPVFENEKLVKVAHNANFDISALLGIGLSVKGSVFDTMVAAALCGYSSYGLKHLADVLFDETMTNITELIGTGQSQKKMSNVPIEQVAPYAAADAHTTFKLHKLLEKKIEKHSQQKVFYEIEMPLLPVIVQIQANGMIVDTDMLHSLSSRFFEEMQSIDQAVEGILGKKLRLTSARDVANALHELNAPKTRKIKSGWSVDSNALEILLQKPNLDERIYQLSDAVLKYRQLLKLKSTYTDNLTKLVSSRDARVHTIFNQVGSATGRLSSSEPNIQNIPIRTELGNSIRKAFKANVNMHWILLSADYSQIELRILAHLCKEPSLIHAFRNGEDIHQATARVMYEVENVSAEQRRVAKILNFGVLYGLGPYGVARQTNLTREQGQQFIQLYFGKYPGIKDFINQAKQAASRLGYAQTLLGRRRYLSNINKNGALSAAEQRMAVNMPIQGTSADIIKLAMVNLSNAMQHNRLRTLMVAQVHDELVFEVPQEELQQVKQLVMQIMPNSVELDVPLAVNLKIGTNWGQMQPMQVN